MENFAMLKPHEQLVQVCTTFSQLPDSLRLFLWITAASAFKLFFMNYV